jgi:hypothetical protein
VRHEALHHRMEVKGLHRWSVAAGRIVATKLTRTPYRSWIGLRHVEK